jgi:CTP synthase (UTP-ammonia lyase)
MVPPDCFSRDDAPFGINAQLMSESPRILLVGDYSEQVVAHVAIPKAVMLAVPAFSTQIGGGLELQWLETADIKIPFVPPEDTCGIWVVPNSPYKNMDGALAAIRFARENKIPFLGTCGGFQHAVIEYARKVLGMSDANHAESGPESAAPVIAKLRCALINQSESITVRAGTRLRKIYGTEQITEGYQCSYGVNPEFEKRLDDGKLKFSAFSWDGAVRALELAEHPFFFATLFQPERSAAGGEAHPLITEFLRAALVHANG